MAIITLTEYKTWAGITGTADDTRLQVLIDSAHAALRRYCGRSLTNGFESATRTEDYETDTGAIRLAEWPVTSVTSVTPIDNTNTLGTAFDSTSYHTELSTGLVKLNGSDNGRTYYDDDDDSSAASYWSWSPRFGRVRVVYVSEAAPADIDMALYRMVDGLYASIRKDPGVASQSLGNWSVTYASPDIAAKAQADLLNPFRSAGVM